MNMNVNNGGQSIQQRIESLKKSQEPKTVNTTPIETGLTGPTFNERKAVFEKQISKVEKQENLLDESHSQKFEDAIDKSGSESMRERSSELHDDQGKLGYGYSSSESSNNYLMKSYNDDGGKKGYGYQVQENESPENEGQDKGYGYKLQESEGQEKASGYSSSEKPNNYLVKSYNDDGGNKGYGYKSQENEAQENEGGEQGMKPVHNYDVIVEQSQQTPKIQKYGLEALDPGTSPHVDNGPKKHQETAQNHHPIQEHGKSNVDGVQRGFEFDLPGQSKYTVMFSSKESQHENQLSFSPQGVSRGDSEELLSTQSPSKGQWAGSKADRMLFVMSPQGEFYTIDPKKAVNIKGATVMDVRIHHSSLLGGQEVAGAGEIRVSAGLKPKEIAHLQEVVQKRVAEQIKGSNLPPEEAQQLLGKLVNEELGKLLKNHPGGQIEVISDRSGHYRPSLKMTAQVLEELESRGIDIDRVNVELGDKTNTPTLLEGEVMIPSRAVIASKHLEDGEAQLRNQQARKSNMHQELLSKTGGTAGPEHNQRINKLTTRIGMLIRAEEFDKAALVFERRALMIGVNVETVSSSGKSVNQQQEEKIIELMSHEPKRSPEVITKLLDAYKVLLEKRHSGSELPEVEVEEGEQIFPKQSVQHSYDEINLRD